MRQPCGLRVFFVPHTQAVQPTTVNRKAHDCQPSGPRTWDEEYF